MTELFVLDIDGCISHPFVTPHWESISKIREYNIKSQVDSTIPKLSICTGRPYPYTEAVAQWLDIQLPVAFESGGGIYFTALQKVEFLSAYYESEQAVEEMKVWADAFSTKYYPETLMEFTKKTDIGFINTDEDAVQDIYERCKEKVANDYDIFEVHRTEISVNVILKGCNKAAGISRLAELNDISLDKVAYIGDSTGDISALKIVNRPFCPSNAHAAVKAISKVMDAPRSEGVLQAYEKLIAENRG